MSSNRPGASIFRAVPSRNAPASSRSTLTGRKRFARFAGCGIWCDRPIDLANSYSVRLKREMRIVSFDEPIPPWAYMRMRGISLMGSAAGRTRSSNNLSHNGPLSRALGNGAGGPCVTTKGSLATSNDTAQLFIHSYDFSSAGEEEVAPDVHRWGRARLPIPRETA